MIGTSVCPTCPGVTRPAPSDGLAARLRILAEFYIGKGETLYQAQAMGHSILAQLSTPTAPASQGVQERAFSVLVERYLDEHDSATSDMAGMWAAKIVADIFQFPEPPQSGVTQ